MKSKSPRTKKVHPADQVDPKAAFDDGGWSAGKTLAEAIGGLILSHGRERGIPVTLTKSAEQRFQRLQEESLKKLSAVIRR